MSKHPHHHGHHHRPTAAEIAAEKAERARIAGEMHQERTVAMREVHGAQLTDQLAAWQQELSSTPATLERPISPLAVPMLVQAQFDSPRRAADGSHYLHGAIDGVPATPAHAPVKVVAALSGRVLFAGDWDPDSGSSVLIGGRDGRIYSYAHLAKGSAQVRVGQQIAQGEAIGIMGNTGNAREGACLHYKVREPVEAARFVRVADTASIDGVISSLQAEPPMVPASLSKYRPAWPSVDGAELHNGMVVEPGLRIQPLPPVITPILDPATLQGLREVVHITPSVLTADLIATSPPLPTLDIVPPLPKQRQ